MAEPPPDNVTVAPGDVGPSIDVCWEEPGGLSLTDVVTEITRESCRGTERVATIVGSSGCWCDVTAPIEEPAYDCDGVAEVCAAVYHLRYWGLLAGVVTTTDWADSASIDVSNPEPGTSYFSRDELYVAICPDETWSRRRPTTRSTPARGGKSIVSTGTPSGRVYQLDVAVIGVDARDALETLLEATAVYYRPALRSDGWFAPSAEVIRPVGAGVFGTQVTLTPCPSPVADPAEAY